MKALITALILLLTFGSFTSCSDSSEEVLVKQEMDSQVEALVGDLDTLEKNIAEGMVLRTTTSAEKAEVKALLKRVRVLSMRLGQFPNDQQAMLALYKALKQIENMDLTVRDQGMFTEMLQTLRVTVDRFATIQNVSFTDLVWDLYFHAFANGFGAYKQIATKRDGANWALFLDKFAKIGGTGTPTDNWLVSPIIDLKKVNKASLFLKHTVRNPNWNKFKLLVSDNYNGADPAESDWVELNITPKSTVAADSWVDLESELISLEQFAGKKIVVAFRYMSDSESNTVWEILSLEFKGTGEGVSTTSYPITFKLPEPEPNPDDLNKEDVFAHSFADGFGEFNQDSSDETAATFKSKTRGGKTYINISAHNPGGDNRIGTTRLVSPVIDLDSKEEVSIQPEFAYGFYKDPSKGLLKILVKDVESGIESDLVEISEPKMPGFTAVLKPNVELPAELKGKKIQIIFSYSSTADQSPALDIHSLAIKAKKAE